MRTLLDTDCILAARNVVEGVPVMSFDKKLNRLMLSLE